MWVGGVEIPAELVDAHRMGRLVLFIGAGASRDSPSDLPDFRELTRSIAQEARYPLSDADLDHPDVLLGRIKDSGVDVHRRVAERLSDPRSRPNRLHEAIADLGRTSPRLRIVTTNFDRHLTSAMHDRGVDVDEYAGPALPMGNDFSGLVYLHGTLSRPHGQLVVTDSDFGKAYLRDAWAARFLERMFATFSVLFIGYSHGDVVMRYLARALGPDGHRFVLTDAPGARDWNDLGLRPIGYEVVGPSHAELGRGVARWAAISGMGLLDHRQRVAELVAAPPSGIPEDASYIEDLICDPERVRLFTELARSIDWLDWASTQPAFKALFDPGTYRSATAGALAAWFVEFYAMNEEHSEHALSLATEIGGYLGPELRQQIGWHLHGRSGPRPDWLGPWLVLLLRDATTADTHWLEYALVDSTWPAHSAQALLLFDYLTEPTAQVVPSFGTGGSRLQISLRGSHHWLHEAWARILEPNLPHVAHALLAIADRHLRRARDLQLAARPGNRDWDQISFGRSAIEPHAQDRYPDPIDVLIDATRDAIEALLDIAHPMAIGYLQSWADGRSQVLQRVAIHGWAHRRDVDASAKLEQVVRAGWLFDHRVRHEAFQLIADALPTASGEAIDALVHAALEPTDAEPEHRPYERFNALAWMDRHRPNHPRITSALADAHAVDPSWQIRADPDLTHSMEFGVVPSRPPMSVKAFHEQIQVSPSALLAALGETATALPWDGKPTWEDSVNLISEAVQTYPEDGHRLLDLAAIEADVAQAVIDGWSRANLDTAAAEGVISRIARLDDKASVVRDVAEMLSSGAQSERHPTNWTAVPGARDLARELWPFTPDGEVVTGEIEWLTRAINHPAGNLAEFWLHVVQHDWRADEAAWRGLVPEHRHAFEAMLSGTSEAIRTQMAQVICASRLHFLFAADQAWTVENVMPLLDWSDAARARRTWDSFTAWGRWNDHMLDAGLMPLYLQTARHLDEFDQESKGAVLGHLAGIALTSDRDPREWLPEVIVGMDVDDRPAFADKVTGILDDLPGEAVEHEWARWMQRYWEDRLASVPTQLSIDEASAMAAWIPFLSTSFRAGVRLGTMHAARFRQHDDVLRTLERHVVDAPDACAELIGHLMRDTQNPWWGGSQLTHLMPQLEAGGRSPHITTILEQALRLGLTLPMPAASVDANSAAADSTSPRRKAPAKKAPAKKAPAKKAPAKKAPAKKAPARKMT